MAGSSTRFVLAASLAVVCALVSSGCQGDGSVHSRSQDQEVRPDGTAVQTRTQIRETGSGDTVRETETRQREVINRE